MSAFIRTKTDSRIIQLNTPPKSWAGCFLLSGAAIILTTIMSFGIVSCKNDDHERRPSDFALAVCPSTMANDFFVTGGSEGQVYVARFTGSGIPVWESRIEVGERCAGRMIKVRNDSVYVLCCPFMSDYRKKAYLIKLDIHGIHTGTRSINLPLRQISTFNTMPDDQFFVLTGISDDSVNHAAGLTKLDLDGNILFSRRYGNHLHGDAVISTDDNGFLLNATPFNGDSSSFLMKTNSEGDSLWAAYYGRPFIAESMCRNGDGSFTLSQQTRGNSLAIWRVDAEGHPIWATQSGTYDVTGVSSIAVGSNGRIYAACYQWIHPESPTGPYTIVCLNDEGLLWKRNCANGQNGMNPAICVTADDNLIVAGSTWHQDNHEANEDIFLVKYNSLSEPLWQKRVGK